MVLDFLKNKHSPSSHRLPYIFNITRTCSLSSHGGPMLDIGFHIFIFAMIVYMFTHMFF